LRPIAPSMNAAAPCPPCAQAFSACGLRPSLSSGSNHALPNCSIALDLSVRPRAKPAVSSSTGVASGWSASVPRLSPGTSGDGRVAERNLTPAPSRYWTCSLASSGSWWPFLRRADGRPPRSPIGPLVRFSVFDCQSTPGKTLSQPAKASGRRARSPVQAPQIPLRARGAMVRYQ
jgi:hypothetical protein